MSKETFKLKYFELEELYKKKYAAGYDVSEAKKMVDKAMQYYKEGDYDKGVQLLDRARMVLEEAKAPSGIASIIVPIVVLLIVVGASYFIWNSLQSSGDYETYSNSEYGFSIKYPKGWVKDETSLGVGAYSSSYGVKFWHPREEVSLIIGISSTEGVSRKISVEDGIEIVAKDLMRGIESVGGKIISSRSFTINGVYAYEFVYTAPVGYGRQEELIHGSFKGKYLCFGTEDSIGTLIYQAPLDEYPKYESRIDECIRSLRIS